MTCESCHGPGKAHVEGQEAARGDEAKTLAANKLIFAYEPIPVKTPNGVWVVTRAANSRTPFFTRATWPLQFHATIVIRVTS